MIGNRVYGPPMRFKIKVNPIPHGGCGRNVLPFQEIVCLYVFPWDGCTLNHFVIYHFDENTNAF